MVTKLLSFILGKWFFVIYFVLGVCYFFCFPLIIDNQSWGNSFFMALGLMTGSDPYSFKDIVEMHKPLWCLAWTIHISSWLLIPALISLVITNAADEIKKEQQLEERLQELAVEVGVKPDDITELVNHMRREIEKSATEQKGDR